MELREVNTSDNTSNSTSNNSKKYKTKLEIDNVTYAIVLVNKGEKLSIKINQIKPDTFPINTYRSEFSKRELEEKTSYFKQFDDINGLFPDLVNLLQQHRYRLTVNESAEAETEAEENLLLMIDIPTIGVKNISLAIKKVTPSVASTVDSLCDMMSRVLQENTEMKKEYTEMKKGNAEMKKENAEMSKEYMEMKKEIENLKREVLELKKDKEERERKEKEKREREEKERKEKEENEKIKNNFSDSSIITNSDDKNRIINWIKPNARMILKLLYKVSRDGDRISTFTQKVAGISPTLVVVESTTGYKFGGFTSQQWNMNGNWVTDNSAFIFSINNKKKYEIKSNQTNNAIYGNSNYFAFGGGHDIIIYNQCTSVSTNYTNGNYSFTASNYELIGVNSNNVSKFIVKECEVYQIIFL